MTESEHTEYMNLINLWNCTEPMTPAQIERMEELDARAMTPQHPRQPAHGPRKIALAQGAGMR